MSGRRLWTENCLGKLDIMKIVFWVVSLRQKRRKNIDCGAGAGQFLLFTKCVDVSVPALRI